MILEELDLTMQYILLKNSLLPPLAQSSVGSPSQVQVSFSKWMHRQLRNRKLKEGNLLFLNISREKSICSSPPAFEDSLEESKSYVSPQMAIPSVMGKRINHLSH